MNYKDYEELISIIYGKYNVSFYQLYLINDVLENCDNIIGDGNYNENEVIDYILKQDFMPNDDDPFEVFCEVKNALGLKEIDEDGILS